jgi:hypothetical protein
MSKSPPSLNLSPRAAGRPAWLVIAAIVGLALFTHRSALTVGLVGYDTYLQIAGARIESWSDFAGTFRENLTDGRIEGRFFRPVQNLFLALDYSLSGLNPRGYQITSLAVYATLVLLLGAVVLRVLGTRVWPIAALVTLYFALHPTLINVVPVAGRRSETLAGMLLLAALAVLPTVAGRGDGWRRAAAGLLIGLSCGAKETAAMGVGLVFLHQWMFSAALWPKAASAWMQLRHAAAAALPALGFVAAYLVNRTIVLKGMGGYPFPPGSTYVERLGMFFGDTILDLFCPFSYVPGVPAAMCAAAAVLLLLAGVAVALARGRPRTDDALGRAAGLVLLGLAWTIPPLLMIGMSRLGGSWYSTFPLVGVALLLAGMSRAAAALWTGGGRGAAALPALGVAVVVLLPLPASPLFRNYDEWHEATRIVRAVLNNVDARLPPAPPGQEVLIVLEPRVQREPPPADRPAVEWVTTIIASGVRAYIEMAHPQLKVCVLPGPADPLPGQKILRLKYTTSFSETDQRVKNYRHRVVPIKVGPP